MIKRTGLTEEQSANSFSDEDLVGQIAPAVPKGWKLLPIEPLLNMMSDRDHDTRITRARS
ncbi:hypothetical protein [Aeromonas sp. QDB21]|uniref:hypothetical protein n=1 Tax=Aeromonas sp. QDB21 TaxID=2990487 RepID=UPI0022E50DCF|nr:hypothetical protein [Aeromonas sp. QDB21]